MGGFNPNRPDFLPYGFTCERWTPAPMSRADRHNEIELNFIREGSITYLLGGKIVQFEAGSLNAFWAARPHQIIEFSPHADYFVATVPLSWFIQREFPDHLVKPLMRGEVATEAAPNQAAQDRFRFEIWRSDLARNGRERRAIVLLEMEARLRRLAARLEDDHTLDLRRGRNWMQPRELNKVEQMASLIAQRFADPLDVGTVAEAVGLSRNDAHRFFKRSLGTTIIDYIKHTRISHAQQLLATTQQKIVEIAFGSGFNSISRFNEVFREACGCTPRSYRKGHSIAGTTSGGRRRLAYPPSNRIPPKPKLNRLAG